MKYLIDTDIASYFLRGKFGLDQKFQKAGRENLCLSVITVAEMKVLANKRPSGVINHRRIDEMAGYLGILDVDRTTWDLYSELQARTEETGRPRGGLDTLQASLARQHGLVIVTHNREHFEGLSAFEDWT